MNIREVIQSFSQLQVLIIGDVMVDYYMRGIVDRISPEAPVPIMRVSKKYFRLGGAGNVALNILALGAKPILCAVVGDDMYGKQLQQRLTELSIGQEGLVRSQTRPTTVKTRVIAAHQHIVRIDEELDTELSNEEEHQLWQRIETLTPKSDVIIFEDYDKGVLSKSLIEKTIQLAKQYNIPTVVDPKKRNFMYYKNVSLFKPNLKELRDGMKIDVSTDNQAGLENAVESLKNTLVADRIMVTLSEHGVYIHSNQSKLKLPAHPREIADVSGAGDTVISVAALCVALKLPDALIASWSNLAGGLVCQHTGVVPIDKNEFIAEVEMLR